jgi:hypothetical protein
LGQTIALYVMVGVATAPNFMDKLSVELERRYEADGIKVRIHALFPYGDWNRKLRKQLLEVRQDLQYLKSGRIGSLRGKLVSEAIQASYSGELIMIVGHSAGGIAGVLAASMLLEQGIQVSKLVSIGSPKYAVPAKLQESLLYVYAVNGKGKSADPITRIGTWGGWQRNSGAMPSWNSNRHAPTHIRKVPIIGGHADYFRSHEPYINEKGATNLQVTMASIWDWLRIES